MKEWREHWYTRAVVWMLIGAPFALAAAVLENVVGWSAGGYVMGFASGVVIATIDGRYGIHVAAQEPSEEPRHTDLKNRSGT